MLTRADSLLPPEMRGEIRACTIAMEAQAEFLKREVKLNGMRVLFRLLKGKSEAEVGEIRAECLESKVGVVRLEDAERGKFVGCRDIAWMNLVA